MFSACQSGWAEIFNKHWQCLLGILDADIDERGGNASLPVACRIAKSARNLFLFRSYGMPVAWIKMALKWPASPIALRSSYTRVEAGSNSLIIARVNSSSYDYWGPWKIRKMSLNFAYV